MGLRVEERAHDPERRWCTGIARLQRVHAATNRNRESQHAFLASADNDGNLISVLFLRLPLQLLVILPLVSIGSHNDILKKLP